MPTDEPRLSELPRLSVITVSGPDAVAFLHGQLTRAVDRLEPGETAFAAWLDARGRVLACFDLIRTAVDRFVLLAPADLAATTVQRLRMFVLRAQVAVVAAADYRCHALTGGALPAAAGVSLPDEPGAGLVAGDRVWIRAAAGLLLTAGTDSPDWLGRATADDAAAEAAAIDAGRPQVNADTAGAFTAHMLNLDRIGAVSFSKGCYPGQEIVARTHNLGTPKRRMFGFGAGCETPPRPGDGITFAGGERAGTVVRAAGADGAVRMLAVARISDIDNGTPLFLGRAELTRFPIPGDSD